MLKPKVIDRLFLPPAGSILLPWLSESVQWP
jgi:hypothetical protein